MSKLFAVFSTCCLAVVFLALDGCSSSNYTTPGSFQLSVVTAGGGGGTVTSSPSGINCGQTCSASFQNGASVTLTAAPNSSSTFTGWSGACSGTGACTVTVNSPTSVTANFTPATTTTQYQLSVQMAGSGTGTVTSSPGGINCGSACSANFSSGTTVTLTAAPNGSSTFAGWSGACTGTATTCSVTLSSSSSVTATFNTTAPPPPNQYQLTVQTTGTGTGTVTSSPSGINCGAACTADFASGTPVTLTAAPSGTSTFGGWSGGGCTGTSTCTVTMTADTTVTATFNPAAGLSSINHIIFLAQENRSFDHYFGALREYWAQNGYPDQPFDGLAQFNPGGTAPSNPGCDPAQPPPADCSISTSNPVTSFHMQSECTENTSPTWDEAHVDWNYQDQLGLYGDFAGNGFVYSAAHDTRNTSTTIFKYDTDGVAAMGYYDGSDLNYYYFMASNFATSDRWFHPVLTRTDSNREFLIGATSQGRVYPNGTYSQDAGSLTAPVIFQELQAAGITWKIYVNPQNSPCTGPPYDPACLVNLSYVSKFTFAQTLVSQYPNNIAPISQYFTDLNSGTLPQVVQIEPAIDAGLDEHGSDSDAALDDVQLGANYVETLISGPKGLMQSPYWKDSAFILTYDESGGLFDHVQPQPAVNPDGIAPVDLQPNDVCTTQPTTPPYATLCDFNTTGYRVPLIVVSPFTKKNYVSHTVMDTTAILKLIETRFGVAPLTKRDAAQPDMTEFFDFQNPPWMTPPANIPAQVTTGTCDPSQMQ